MGSVTTIRQQFYKNASIPPITLEHVDLASLTTTSVANLVATLSGTRLGVAASYGEKCVLDALTFSTETRILLITMDDISRSANPQKHILRDLLLCNTSLEKHGFFMERIAAALHLDLGLYIRRSFDIASDGDQRGSMAAYKDVLERARAEDSLDERAVESIFTEQAFILSRKAEFAQRAWACYVGVQGDPDKPGAINTKRSQARPIYLLYIGFP